MSDNLRPGQKGERLPGGMVVVRLSKSVFDMASAHASQFDLSTADKESDLQSLSVWAIDLTPADKARELMGEKRVDYRAALHLNVDDIRNLQFSTDSPERPLDVVWDPLLQPGAEGLSDIVGLLRPKEAPVISIRHYERGSLQLPLYKYSPIRNHERPGHSRGVVIFA